MRVQLEFVSGSRVYHAKPPSSLFFRVYLSRHLFIKQIPGSFFVNVAAALISMTCREGFAVPCVTKERSTLLRLQKTAPLYLAILANTIPV